MWVSLFIFWFKAIGSNSESPLAETTVRPVPWVLGWAVGKLALLALWWDTPVPAGFTTPSYTPGSDTLILFTWSLNTVECMVPGSQSHFPSILKLISISLVGRNLLFHIKVLTSCKFKCCCLVVNLCPTLLNPMDYSPPRSSVHEISQARILEWIAISFSRGSCQVRDWTHISCIGTQILYHWATREAS